VVGCDQTCHGRHQFDISFAHFDHPKKDHRPLALRTAWVMVSSCRLAPLTLPVIVARRRVARRAVTGRRVARRRVAGRGIARGPVTGRRVARGRITGSVATPPAAAVSRRNRSEEPAERQSGDGNQSKKKLIHGTNPLREKIEVCCVDSCQCLHSEDTIRSTDAVKSSGCASFSALACKLNRRKRLREIATWHAALTLLIAQSC